MAAHKLMKKLARKRQRRTGESYTRCLAIVQARVNDQIAKSGKRPSRVMKRLLDTQSQ